MSAQFPHYIDKAWRVEIFDEDDDPEVTSNVSVVHYERIPYTDNTITTKWNTPADRGGISASSNSDGGKAASVSVAIGSGGLNSTQAKAYDLNAAVLAVKGNIDFADLKLSDFRFFLRAYVNILDAQSEERRILNWRLANDDITQAQYDIDIALLVPTADG